MLYKVSIIIATYNSGKTLLRALNSVLKQTSINFECIVVDGLSTDNTVDIIKQISDKDDRFKYISEKDNGIYDAFNKGWRLAKGEWIYYLGSDDWLEEDGLYKLINSGKEGYAILSGSTNLIRSDNTVRCLKAGYPNLGCHQGMVMKKELIQSLNGFNEEFKIIADYDLIIRALNQNYKMQLIDVTVANFVIGGTSQSLKNSYVYFKERYKINKQFKSIKHPFIATCNTCLKKYLSVLIRQTIKKVKRN